MDVDAHTTWIDETSVFFYDSPSGLDPILYLHGAPTSADDWEPFLARTGGIAPDLPGFGRSDKSGHLDYSIAGYVDFLERFMEKLEVRRCRLVAHDWGAALGLALAQRDPERIERLVLLDAVPLLADFRWHRLARLWRTPVLGELTMGWTTHWLLRRGLRCGSSERETWPRERVAAVWEQFDQGTQRATLRLYRNGSPSRLEASGLGLEELEAPTLIVWGEDDPWLAPELARRYAERLPDAEVEIVPGAGHWPWLDRPEVVERVAAFLQ